MTVNKNIVKIYVHILNPNTYHLNLSGVNLFNKSALIFNF